jgi:hypothetical protein
MGNEDQEFSFRVAKAGGRLKYVGEAAVYHQHLTSVRRYLKRKFTIGYWKAQLLRWHPEKALGDAHTPASQRLQVLLAGPLAASAVLGLAWRPALWVAGLLGAAFVTSAAPFLGFVARRDPAVLLVVGPMLVGRALAQALGLGVGAVWGAVRGPARQGMEGPVNAAER